MVTQKTISVGDAVCFTLVKTQIHGVVVDDRGPIGANRVHIFSISIPNDSDENDVVEMPEDELALVKENG